MSLRTLAGLLIAVTLLPGCSKDLESLGLEQGRIAAGTSLPELPTECEKQYNHAPIVVGDDPVVVLKRERRIVDQANGTIRICAAHSKTVKRLYEAKVGPK